ncbi:MAG: hypothetical protein K1X94_15860 [Sandaracinaceae bacterium]|nr:hypothetical protein [Sandaracinaceae bacterium]
MFRSVSFSVVLLATLVVGASSASAQRAMPIPGTNARIALPSGCGLSGPGSITCGGEQLDVGGSSLGFDEMLAAYRASGHEVHELPVPGRRLFFAAIPGGRMVLVRDGDEERLVLLARSSRPGFEAGQTFARVVLAIEPPARGPIVTGFEGLTRDRLPYATVYWSDGSLTFTSSAIGTDDRMGISGFLRETQGTSMTELCDNRTISDRMPSTLLLRHQRQLTAQVSLCEEAFTVDMAGRRVLAAQFGYVMHDGHAYSLTMTYSLEPTEDPVGCLTGFEHFALPILSDVLGIGSDDDERDERGTRHARR